MRVPEARSTARVGVISTPRASAEAFGAGVARGIEEVGGAVSRLGGMAMEVAVEQKRQKVIREAEDGYSNWLRQANDISNTEVFSKAGAQTDHLLDDDERPENSGFVTNYTSKLDKAFTDVSANLSPNAKQRLGVMVQNQRLAYETRARNHVFTQQNEAAKYSAKVAVEVSQDSVAQLARAYTKKQPDGTVNVQWSEVDRVMGDVVSAQSIYNARTGTPNEITLEDGTKKNVLAETARAGAHQKVIDTLMAAGEYDEAQAYLAGLKAEKRPDGSANPYLNDFDGKQVKATEDAIQSGKDRQQRKVESVEVDRLYKDTIDNPDEMFRKSAKELVSTYGKLPASMQVSLLKGNFEAEEKARNNPVPTEEDYTYFSGKIAALKPGDKVGWMMLGREMRIRGLKPETEKPLFNMMEEFIKPVEGTEKFTEQYATEKAKFIKEMAEANNKSKGWGSLIPGSVDDKGKPVDATTEYAGFLAREMDSMNGFITERSKKVGYSQAITDFWEQPHVKEMRDKNNIRVMIDHVTNPGAAAETKKQVESGLNTLTNRTFSVQSSLYVSDDDFNGITGLKF